MKTAYAEIMDKLAYRITWGVSHAVTRAIPPFIIGASDVRFVPNINAIFKARL